MEKRIVQFKGMTNVPDDGINEAGDMSVLLNMRHKGGELVQCQPPSEAPTGGDIKKVIYHKASDSFLELTNSGKIYLKNTLIEGVVNFEVLGNSVIIYKSNSTLYYVWQKDSYKVFNALNKVPDLTIKIEKNYKYLNSGYAVDNNPDSNNYYWRAQKGVNDKILTYIYEQKGYVDRAFFRVGVKMFDGSYVVGEIYECSNYKNISDEKNLTEKTIGVQLTDFQINGNVLEASLDYFVPTFKVEALTEELADLIVSIDVFSTGSIMSHRPGWLDTKEESNPVPGIEIYKQRTAEELKLAILDAEFYKVASFNINGESTWKIDNTSPSNFSAQSKLDNIRTHDIIVNQAMVHNSRLHAYDYKTIFFKGYSSIVSNYGQALSDELWDVYVFLQTGEGVKVVYRKDKPIGNNKTYLHTGYFTYPDSRAYKMLVVRNDNSYAELDLQPHPSRDEAYFLKTKEIYEVRWRENINGFNIDASVYEVPVVINELPWKTDNLIRPEVEVDFETKNTLKVSAVDSLFYFPTEQTYKFDGDIAALASNAEAISTGQFGQYPLYVFTTEGIWAMQVDSTGKTAYSNQTPFSREVCCGDACQVSGGVVFTTERGLMAISGGNVVELSKPLDGLEELLFNSSGMLAGQIFTRAEYDDHTKFEPVPIREYIKDAKLAYNYLHNEVILSNPNEKYKYSYVYSLDNQTWGMIDKTFDVTTNSYPELVVYDNKERKRYTFDDADTNAVPVVAITRPFTLGSFDYKRLRQAALRTTFTGSLNFYLLGSNNGANFVCITGKEYPSKNGSESMNVTRRDLITAMSRSKQYKYFAIAIAGNMKGRVSLAELLVDAGFANNQLR